MKFTPVKLGVKDIIIVVLGIVLSWVILFSVVSGINGKTVEAKELQKTHAIATGENEADIIQEELDSQMEFADMQKEIEKKDSSKEEYIMSRLRYVDQHPTFDRTLPDVFNYTVGGDGIDPIANYIYHKTKDLPHPTLGKIGMELVKTWSLENSRFNLATKGALDERGICQVRYKYHSAFMNSQEFRDPYKNVDYCVDIYLDWYNRTRHNGQTLQDIRSAWSIRDRASSRFEMY